LAHPPLRSPERYLSVSCYGLQGLILLEMWLINRNRDIASSRVSSGTSPSSRMSKDITPYNSETLRQIIPKATLSVMRRSSWGTVGFQKLTDACIIRGE